MLLSTVAIVGRPNVGKSSLLNKIVGYRHAIVDPTPGVTRDRNYAESEWNGRRFHVVDTGGLDPDNHTPLMTAIRGQVEFALQETQAIIFLCDSVAGLVPADRQILNMLRKCPHPIFIAVNKIDNPRDEQAHLEFFELGIDTIYPISAVHGHGVADLLDDLVAPFERTAPLAESDERALERIAIVGKPNVGKSALFNRLVGTERSIVDDVPGTTRDTILVTIERNNKTYRFIDTAGLRRPNRDKDAVEQYSVFRTLGAIKRSDLAVLVLDASEGGIAYQDKRIAGRIVEAGSGCIIVWNKWDIAERGEDRWRALVKETQEAFPALAFAPIIPTSARTGQRVPKLFDMIDEVQTEGKAVIPPDRLKSILFEALTIQPPPSFHGRAVRISAIHQLSGPPIVFKVKCSEPEGLHFSYQRYLLNHIRQERPFPGWPIKLLVGSSRKTS